MINLLLREKMSAIGAKDRTVQASGQRSTQEKRSDKPYKIKDE